MLVRLDAFGRCVPVDSESITNFSLAARKAWITGPNRAVGHRKGTKLCDRVSVTLRIDRDLWQRFRDMEDADIIEDRTAAVNARLREKLGRLELAKPGTLRPRKC